ncbi:MAG TPA: ATP-binding protein [Thermomonospora sp.]|nr:ATP-binding protein [Thermomonospora sp.]
MMSDDETGAMILRYRLRQGLEGTVAQARALTAAMLEGVHQEHLSEDAGLIVSELATNAIKATPGKDVVLVLRDEEDAVFIGVWDCDTHVPEAVCADPLAESGRGLLIVAALSSDHGCEPVPGGKVMWARLSKKR